ncbi:hypothetical protein PWG71_00680 [Nocardiopsis sp. N85]|uniref:hypothetical protein n=1 Tax=Nocardiopsis sp. N85 TaxID=3029400 RepID=UPI00237F3F57|nr:hypothetical protein [Nocardiopsis sp. N85]MDE3719886.1 hypothetical protein [Nocardiopsis sp. N85]
MNRRIEVEAMSMSSLPDTVPENEAPVPEGPLGWPMILLIIVICLAVVASGWWVAKAVFDEPVPSQDRRGSPSASASPEDPVAFVEQTASRMESADSYAVSFTRRKDGTPVGEGTARYDTAGTPLFEHSFTYIDGTEVYRYDLGDGTPITTAGHGLQIPTEPTDADRYLCSTAFGTAKLHEITGTSPDIEFLGREEVETEEGATAALRYEGTFTATLGDYDVHRRENTLTSEDEAAFTLWVSPEGRPLRLLYVTPEGVEEAYEYEVS